MTVGEYLERWLSDCVRGTVRESTFSRDKYLVNNHVIPALGRVKLKNLGALRLQGLYRDRLDAGLSAATVQKMHHVLHKALDQAVRWNLIPTQPRQRGQGSDALAQGDAPALRARGAWAARSGPRHPSGGLLRAGAPYGYEKRRVARPEVG